MKWKGHKFEQKFYRSEMNNLAKLDDDSRQKLGGLEKTLETKIVVHFNMRVSGIYRFYGGKF